MWYLVGRYPTRKVWIKSLGNGEVEFWNDGELDTGNRCSRIGDQGEGL